MARYWIIFLAVAASAYGGYAVFRKYRVDSLPATPAKRIIYSGPRLTDYRLTDQNGQTFDSRTLDGRVTLTSFFFTSCPAICLRMNRALAGLQQPISSTDVRWVSITCDPQTDKPAVLRQYAEQLDADQDRWTFLTGDLGYIERIAIDLFGINDVTKSTHSDRVVVTDRAGKVRGRFQVTEPAELKKLTQLVEHLASE